MCGTACVSNNFAQNISSWTTGKYVVQDGADALIRATEAAKKKADDAVKDVKEAVNSEL